MARTLKWPIALALLTVLGYGGWQFLLYKHHLSFVPDAMGVQQVLYVSEEMWGFGPGGNETGIIVYEMPEAIAADLSTGGLDKLNNLSSQTINPDRRGRYTRWQLTPIEVKGAWAPAESVPDASPIENYLGRYGFPIPVRNDVVRLANDALLKPGSFYAHGRSGMIILIPSAKRIIYAYSG